jgi:hypothetical protein
VSYFTFLRTLLYLNIPVFLLSVAFIVIPQILYRFLQQEPAGYVSNQNFTGRELLTGAVSRILQSVLEPGYQDF